MIILSEHDDDDDFDTLDFMVWTHQTIPFPPSLSHFGLLSSPSIDPFLSPLTFTTIDDGLSCGDHYIQNSFRFLTKPIGSLCVSV